MIDCPLCMSEKVSSFAALEEMGETKRYYRCSVCELTFLDPKQRLPAGEEKARYDLHQNNPEDAGYVSFLNRMLDPLKKFIRPGASGLDFGCGPGPTITPILSQAGYSMTDYDPFYFPDEGWRERTFDFVTSTEVFEHLFNPGQVMAQLTKVLTKPGNVLGVMTQLLTDEVDFSTWWYRQDPTHVCFYSPATFAWIARTYGFKIAYSDTNVMILTKK